MCELWRCIICESAGASSSKWNVSSKTSVKSNLHFYALLKSLRVALLQCVRLARNDRHHFPLAVSLLQASPDVDEEGFSLRPGDEGDDILLVGRRSSTLRSLRQQKLLICLAL